ncbi:MAG: type II toxin-antitoxin system VapC family toxin [Anaerolineales bacterium]|nr:type II toxin-antitoxin system VapC family toxin [Anaerolineales bacterium]
MNLYFDTSALIKHYVEEDDSNYINELIAGGSVVATGLTTRAEMASGINRLLRMNSITQEHYSIALRDFRSDWHHYERIAISEEIVARADSLTGEYSLRGYDAIHLACGLTWQDALELPVTIVTYDIQLKEAAQKAGLLVLPE